MADCILSPNVAQVSGHRRRMVRGVTYMAHRLAWEEAHGPIPNGLCVLHRCDNPGCINVEHLFLGTRADNNRDRAAKGRSGTGLKHARAKLNPDSVSSIKRALGEGAALRALARQYGVHWTSIRDIRDGQSWATVQPGPEGMRPDDGVRTA